MCEKNTRQGESARWSDVGALSSITANPRQPLQTSDNTNLQQNIFKPNTQNTQNTNIHQTFIKAKQQPSKYQQPPIFYQPEPKIHQINTNSPTEQTPTLYQPLPSTEPQTQTPTTVRLSVAVVSVCKHAVLFVSLCLSRLAYRLQLSAFTRFRAAVHQPDQRTHPELVQHHHVDP